MRNSVQLNGATSVFLIGSGYPFAVGRNTDPFRRGFQLDRIAYCLGLKIDHHQGVVRLIADEDVFAITADCCAAGLLASIESTDYLIFLSINTVSYTHLTLRRI